MADNLEHILVQIHDLEQRAAASVARKKEELRCRIVDGKVLLPDDVIARHKRSAKRILRFFYDAGVGGMVIAPVMYSMIEPLAFLDLA